MSNPFIDKAIAAQAEVTCTDLVRWQDTPRIYVIDCANPKNKDLPKTFRKIDIGMRQSNDFMDEARKLYGRRTGYSVVPMFPHTYPPNYES